MAPNGPNVPMTEINNEISTMRKVETVNNILAIRYVLGTWIASGPVMALSNVLGSRSKKIGRTGLWRCGGGGEKRLCGCGCSASMEVMVCGGGGLSFVG